MTHRVAVLLCLATVAYADNLQSAREHYQKGTTLYDIGRYAEAAKEYEEAYTLKDDPVLLFNMGQAYRLGGESEKALRSYRSFLRRAPDSSKRAIVEGYIQSLQKLVDDQKRAANIPPIGTIPLGQPGASAEPAPIADVPAVEHKTPVYKKWWLWTAVGVVVGAGIAVAVAVPLTTPNNAPAPPGTPTVMFGSP